MVSDSGHAAQTALPISGEAEMTSAEESRGDDR
jgi:hypothetical protein